jgi:hypothetical protein
MKIKKDIWNGGGYLYDDGDVPQCDYCGENAKEKAIYSKWNINM